MFWKKEALSKQETCWRKGRWERCWNRNKYCQPNVERIGSRIHHIWWWWNRTLLSLRLCHTPHRSSPKKSLKLYCAYHCCREYFSFISVEEDTKLLTTDGIAASIWQGIVFNNDSKPLFERGIKLMAKMNTPILFNELYPACFPSFHQWNCHRCAPPLSNFPPFSNKVWSCGDTIQIPSITFCCKHINPIDFEHGNDLESSMFFQIVYIKDCRQWTRLLDLDCY